MAKVAAPKRGISDTTTIDQAFAAFLHQLKEEQPASAVTNAKSVLEILRHHLDTEDDQSDDVAAFCNRAASADLIAHLDRFLRYCVMRELVLKFEQQEFVFFVIYDFCEWLEKSELLSDTASKAFLKLKKNHKLMWKQAYTAVKEIDAWIDLSKLSGKPMPAIEFARHDITKIEGDKIWLEIWSPIILPDETLVGPITLPANVAASLQVGWMITCSLAKSKSKWQIIEVGTIYPSLPF